MPCSTILFFVLYFTETRTKGNVEEKIKHNSKLMYLKRFLVEDGKSKLKHSELSQAMNTHFSSWDNTGRMKPERHFKSKRRNIERVRQSVREREIGEKEGLFIHIIYDMVSSILLFAFVYLWWAI